MESKRKNVYIAIFVITTIIAGCVAVYFGIMGYKDRKELQSKIDNLESNNKVEENSSNNENLSRDKIKEDIVNNFDESKLINKPQYENYYTYKLVDNDENSKIYGISGKIQQDENTISIKIDWSKKPFGITGDYNGEQEYTLSFNSKIADVIFASDRIDAYSEKYIFLLEDGTGEYIPLYNACKDNKIMSYGKIDNVKDIVHIQKGFAAGGYTVFAFKEDGTFYDLFAIISELLLNN